MNLPDLTPPLDRDGLLGRTMQRAAVLAIARRRRRHFVQLGSAMALAVVLAGTSVTVLALRDDRHLVIVPGATTSSSTTSTSVAGPGVPKGWVPVDYGDLQISVPAGWSFVDPEECATGQRDTVYENVDSGVHCPAERTGPGPSVWLYTQPPTGPAPSGEQTINGIHVFTIGPLEYEADGVGISLVGRASMAELRTLTYSPRSVALAPGKAPAVPKSWVWMTQAYWRIAVPAPWVAAGQRLGSFSVEGAGCAGPFKTLPQPGSFAALDSDSTLGWAEKCPLIPPTRTPPKPVDGLIINVNPRGSWPDGTPVCSIRNGLRICIADGLPDVDILYVWVHVPQVTGHTEILEIGLAGSGQTARTVLDSLTLLPPGRVALPG